MSNGLARPLRRRALARVAVAAAAGSWQPGGANTSVLEVVYPRLAERPVDAYGYRLLELALQRSGEPFQLRLTDAPLSSRRAREELAAGRVQVLDGGISREAEAAFDLVPFALDLGLSGLRQLLARRSLLPVLAEVRTLQDLKALRFGQGDEWVDTRILRAAGLRVDTSQFLNLFRMLEAGRFDLYPLGVEEIHAALRQHQALAPSAVLVPGLALHYPLARKFMVTRGHTRLREALLRGLQQAHAEGAVLAVLQLQAGLAPLLGPRAQVPERIVRLPNPELPAVYRQVPASALHPLVRPLAGGAA
ncbi:hypothetical protein [Inhella proteolytica]|uniref:Solute-binding protein family 3/N-terminal domain-containing protein n=1 Tax=Inhella proteolytica TaxID=2795029 RepID=A0A931J1L3_9BURK|nr:hypothetical protein [Inhella proteolytica]MBH9576671.1 hypothetical protein [Inhella proteolytica]